MDTLIAKFWDHLFTAGSFILTNKLYILNCISGKQEKKERKGREDGLKETDVSFKRAVRE